MFKMIENHKNRNQNHDLKFHIIISSVVEIMCDHMLSHCEAFHTDVSAAVHHAEMIVKVNNQIKEIIMLFNKKHVSSVIFLDNLFKQ